MKMLLFIYLRWGRKFGGIWVIDSSEMKENAAVVRKQLQNSSENTNNHECNQSKLRIVLLSYSRLLLIPAARLVHCKRRSLELVQTEQGYPGQPTRLGLKISELVIVFYFFIYRDSIDLALSSFQRILISVKDGRSLIETIVTSLEILIILKSLLAKCIFNGTRFDWFHFWLLE